MTPERSVIFISYILEWGWELFCYVFYGSMVIKHVLIQMTIKVIRIDNRRSFLNLDHACKVGYNSFPYIYFTCCILKDHIIQMSKWCHICDTAYDWEYSLYILYIYIYIYIVDKPYHRNVVLYIQHMIRTESMFMPTLLTRIIQSIYGIHSRLFSLNILVYLSF